MCQNSGLFPLVNISRKQARFEQTAQEALDRGALGFVIHPILEKTDPREESYFPIAELAQKNGVPLVCRTGRTQYLGNPHAEFGAITRFSRLVSQFPKLSFVMSHSNLSEFATAIDFAREHENVILDTVWQNVFSVKKNSASDRI